MLGVSAHTFNGVEITFPFEIWLAYTVACVLIVLTPGPDIILSIARGLSQGRLAACMSILDAGIGILCHSATVQPRPLALRCSFGLLSLRFGWSSWSGLSAPAEN